MRMNNNLLDTYRYRYTDFDADRNYENNHLGRTILFSARFKMRAPRTDERRNAMIAEAGDTPLDD